MGQLDREARLLLGERDYPRKTKHVRRRQQISITAKAAVPPPPSPVQEVPSAVIGNPISIIGSSSVFFISASEAEGG